MSDPTTRYGQPPMSRRLATETVLITGAVFAIFGVYLLWESKPAAASDGILARYLLILFEPAVASVVAGYFVLIAGVVFVVTGLYFRFRKNA